MRSIKLISLLIILLKLLHFILFYYTSNYVKMFDQVTNPFSLCKNIMVKPDSFSQIM